MKVNILGKGIIPGIGTLAPKYDVDLSELEIKRLLNYQQLRLGDVMTGLLITKANVDSFFNPPIATELPDVKSKKKEAIKNVEKEVEEPKKAVYDDPIIEIKEISPIEITPPETVVEVTAVSERIGNVQEIIPEKTNDDPISVEVVETETTRFSGKNKKRRRN